MDYPVTLLAEPRAVRLVATGRLRDPVLHLLLDDPAAATRSRAEIEELARALAEIEGGTSARLTAQATLGAVLPSGRPHANFVNAAFAYWRPRERNRFNDAGFGAWYAAFDTATSAAEVTYHIGRELERVEDWHATVEWSEMWASFAGAFVDLRGIAPPPVCLHPDPAIGYPPGNALAREARGAGHNGIVYPSVRRPRGTCLVALWPHVVQSVTQGAIVRATWTGVRTPSIETL
ncbi:MAG TPA: RES family NAD+ phosphorylase [Acetobacteraceae bacterium]|nr:RES family NAD+ phosphorylase [Acetobacteraceae bacterium]